MSIAKTSDEVTLDPPRDGRDARWETHRIARRRELVESSIKAIRRHGAGIGMDEIAAEAGTSKTVFYRHFGDRLGLYFAICEAVDARLLKQFSGAIEPIKGHVMSPELMEGLTRAVIDGYLTLVEKDPELYQFVVRRPSLNLPDGTDPVTGLTDRIATTFASVMASLHGENAAPREFRVVAWALVGLVKESADRWLADADRPPREELTNALTQFALQGLSSLPR